MEAAFKGLRAAVTGDVAGLGRAAAGLLAAGGAHIAFCTPQVSDATAAVQALSEHGTHVTVTTIGLADGAALARWVNTAAADFEGLDLVLCSLGAAPADAAVQLLNAARSHLARSPQGRFVAVGDGALQAALAREAAGLRLQVVSEAEIGAATDAAALARLLA
jgi:enoyl-[acyl-carrier-protein] reductase (NADH)